MRFCDRLPWCADLNTRCAWQESHLAVLWTIGVFALNFGPVVVGPILDYVGPKLTAMFGKHQGLHYHVLSLLHPVRFAVPSVLPDPCTAWRCHLCDGSVLSD